MSKFAGRGEWAPTSLRSAPEASLWVHSQLLRAFRFDSCRKQTSKDRKEEEEEEDHIRQVDLLLMLLRGLSLGSHLGI